MKIIVQRVKSASVHIGGKVFDALPAHGMLIYFGVRKGDTEKSADWLCEKALGLRIFEDENGKMNLSVSDVGGGVLIVPQFTLYGSCDKGKRPGFDLSAPFDEAERLFDHFVRICREKHGKVHSGKFRADMQVESINDGPVTFIIEHPVLS